MKRKVTRVLDGLAVVAVVLAAVLYLSGCVSLVLPSHANAIDPIADNASAFSAKVQATSQPTASEWQAFQKWVAADAVQWQYVDDWAHGKHPAPTIQPAK